MKITQEYLNDKLMECCITSDSIRTALTLIDLGADVNSNKNKHSELPILYAVFSFNSKMVEFLISMGADLTIIDDDGDSLIDLIFNFIEEVENSLEKIKKSILSEKRSLIYEKKRTFK